MGKMKELFIQQRDEEISNMSDAEYQDHLHSAARDTYTDTNENGDPCCGGDCHCEGESVTQKESQANYDAWWANLTDEQKQQLYEEQESYEKERMEREMDIEDRMDIEDEMNHDLSFGK